MATQMEDTTNVLDGFDAVLSVRGIPVRVLRMDQQQEGDQRLFNPRRPGAVQRLWRWLFGGRDEGIGRDALLATAKGAVEPGAHELLEGLTNAELTVVIGQIEGVNTGFTRAVTAAASDRMAAEILKRQKVVVGLREAADHLSGVASSPGPSPSVRSTGKDPLRSGGFTPIGTGPLPQAMPGVGRKWFGPEPQNGVVARVGEGAEGDDQC